MNSITTKIGTLAICCGLLATTGCTDFLQESPKTDFTEGNYFQTENQAQKVVDGAYERLRALQNYDGYGESPWVTLDLLCGHATTLGQSAYNNTYIRHGAATNNPSFKAIWEGFYKGVANCNLCITGIPAIDATDVVKTKLLGEVYALRAFYYFHLVRLYGDIPLIQEPVASDSENMYPVRATKEQVANAIVADLKKAELAGLPNTDETGRVSVGFVKTLLADVYLYMAGNPLNKGKAYYELSYQKAKEVLDNTSYNGNGTAAAWYSLFDNYDALHDDTNRNKGEFIFQVQYKEGIQDNQIAFLAIPSMKQVTKYNDEFGSLMPTWDFYRSYEAGDKRVEEKQMFFTKDGHKNDKTQIVEFGTPALYKYYDKEGAENTTRSDLNFTLYRLPELMFIYVEAYTEATGAPDQLSYNMLNAVRERANLAPVSGLAKDDFMQVLRKERAHELCFENKDYFHIQRTHLAYNVKTNRFESYDSFANESNVTFTEKYLLWPIPSTETDANPKLLPNNTGW